MIDKKADQDYSDKSDAISELRRFCFECIRAEHILAGLNSLLECDSYTLTEDSEGLVSIPASCVHPYLKAKAEQTANKLSHIYATGRRMNAARKQAG